MTHRMRFPVCFCIFIPSLQTCTGPAAKFFCAIALFNFLLSGIVKSCLYYLINFLIYKHCAVRFSPITYKKHLKKLSLYLFIKKF
jgi:hypothetical protein